MHGCFLNKMPAPFFNVSINSLSEVEPRGAMVGTFLLLPIYLSVVLAFFFFSCKVMTLKCFNLPGRLIRNGFIVIQEK